MFSVNHATHSQMILGSDTVYPGKPFTDTVAFFAMVVELLVSGVTCNYCCSYLPLRFLLRLEVP